MVISNNLFFYFFYFLILIFFGLIFLCVFNYYQYGDDFVFILGVEKYGVFGNMIYKYFNWDGRHLSIAGFFQMFYFKYLSPAQSIFLGLSFLCCSIFIFLKSFDLIFNKKYFLFIVAVFMVGLIPFYKEVLIWQTGVVYLIFLFQTCLSFYIYNKSILPSFWKFVIILLLSINSQNLNFSFGVYVFLNLVFRFKPSTMRFDSLILFAIFLGTLFVSLAPGNLERMAYQNSGPVFADPFYVYIPKFIWKSFLYSKYLFLAGLLAGPFIEYNFKVNYRYIGLFILIGLSSIIPFFIIPESFNIRIIFPVAFFFFFSGIICFGLVKNYFPSVVKIIPYLNIIYVSVGVYILFNQLLIFKEVGEKIKMREIYLLSLPPGSVASFKFIDKPDDLIISRSPSYEDLWRSEFLEYYNLSDFKQYR